MFLIGKLLSKIIDNMTIVGGLIITAMMLHITIDVILRFAFNTPLPGTITIVSYYYMVAAVFIPLAFAEQKNSHISVEVVTDHLPAFLQKYLVIISNLSAATVFSLLLVRTWEEAEKKRAIGASIVQGGDSISIWITYYFVPIGCGLMVLIAIYKLVVNLFGFKSGLDSRLANADDNDMFNGTPGD